MVSRESKALLSNIIRHTDAHNKIVEEAAMWRQREATLSIHTRSCDHPRGSHKRKHRSCSPDQVSSGRPPKLDSSGSERNHRTADLQQFEAPADRWGHGGYKELYPEEFQSVASKLSRSSIPQAEQQNASTLDTNKESSYSCHKRKDKKKKKHKKDRKDRKHANDEAPDMYITASSSWCRLRSSEQGNCCLQRTCDGTESSAESPAALCSLSLPECHDCQHGSSEDFRGHRNGKLKKALKSKKVKVHKRKKKSRCKTR